MTELDEALLYARRSGVPVYQHQTVAEAYLAGARWAREQERERAGPFVDYVMERARHPDGARARDILAKHKETAR